MEEQEETCSQATVGAGAACEVEELDTRVRLSKGVVHYRLVRPRPVAVADSVTPQSVALPLVVCVHGIDHVARVWDFFALHLAQQTGHAVLSFDMYERGGSKLDDPDLLHLGDLFVEQLHELWQLVTASSERDDGKEKLTEQEQQAAAVPLSKDNFVLIGHSMGGALSLLFAHRYPNLVSSLILIGSAGMKFNIPLEMQLIRIPALGPRLFQWLANQEDMMKEDFMDLERSKAAIAHVMEHTKGMYGSREFAKAFTNSLNNFPLRSLESIIPEVGKYPRPSLIMWGQHDQLISRELWLPRFEEAFGVGIIAHHKSVVISDTKHSPFLERIDEVNEIIATFIREHMNEHPNDDEHSPVESESVPAKL